MKETLILIGIYLLFLTLSFLLRRVMLKVNLKWLILIVPVYLISIYFYFDLAVRIHQTLRERGIYLEFGHGEIMLLELELACYITAVCLILNVFYSRSRFRNNK